MPKPIIKTKKPAKKTILKKVTKKTTKKQVAKPKPILKKSIVKNKKIAKKSPKKLIKWVIVFAMAAMVVVSGLFVNNQFLAKNDDDKSVLGSWSNIMTGVSGSWNDETMVNASSLYAKILSVRWKSSNPNVAQVLVSKNDARKAIIYFLNSGETTITVDLAFKSIDPSPIKVTVTRGPVEPTAGYDSSRSENLRGVSMLVENGCDNTIVNNYKKYFMALPSYLINYKEVRFLTNNSMPSSLGLSLGVYAIAIKCNSYEPFRMVHESAHTIDKAYNKSTNTNIGISNQSDFINIYNKYVGLKNNGEKYFYDSASGDTVKYLNYAHSNPSEFFASVYTVYFNRYLLSVESAYFNTSYTFPQDVKDILRKYIPKLDTEKPTTPNYGITNTSIITYAKWYNKNSKEAKLIGGEVAQVKFMSDKANTWYNFWCTDSSGKQIININIPNTIGSSGYGISNEYYTYSNRTCYIAGVNWDNALQKNFWGGYSQIYH